MDYRTISVHKFRTRLGFRARFRCKFNKRKISANKIMS